MSRFRIVCNRRFHRFCFRVFCIVCVISLKPNYQIRTQRTGNTGDDSACSLNDTNPIIDQTLFYPLTSGHPALFTQCGVFSRVDTLGTQRDGSLVLTKPDTWTVGFCRPPFLYFQKRILTLTFVVRVIFYTVLAAVKDWDANRRKNKKFKMKGVQKNGQN